MKNPEAVLKHYFEEECRSRSGAPQVELKVRSPRNPAWRPVGAVAAAAVLLSIFTLGMQYRQPTELDRLIAGNLPSEETWEQIVTRSSEIVITALEGRDER